MKTVISINICIVISVGTIVTPTQCTARHKTIPMKLAQLSVCKITVQHVGTYLEREIISECSSSRPPFSREASMMTRRPRPPNSTAITDNRSQYRRPYGLVTTPPHRAGADRKRSPALLLPPPIRPTAEASRGFWSRLEALPGCEGPDEATKSSASRCAASNGSGIRGRDTQLGQSRLGLPLSRARGTTLRCRDSL